MKSNYTFVKDDGKLAMVKCLKCEQENYALNVLSGICTWCGFDANEKLKDNK